MTTRIARVIAHRAHSSSLTRPRPDIRFCTRPFSSTLRVAAEAPQSSSSPPEVVLYQYAICPFCNISKAALEFASVNYNAVEVNPLTKAEIKWSKDYRKVPIATVDGEQVNGSEEIIKKCLGHPAVASNLQKKDIATDAFMESKESLKWLEFAREELASLLYPNICSSWNDSYVAFDYVHNVDTFSTFQKFSIQNAGSLAMYFAASKIKKKRGITDERQALNDVLAQLEEEGLGGGKKYLSGTETPCLGDVAVYGTLRAIEGLPAHAAIFDNRGGPLPPWYQRMKSLIE